MPVNLSIRNVPDDVAERLRERARQNHRSLQGELMAIFEEAAETSTSRGLREDRREFRSDDRSIAPKKKLSAREALKQMRALGVRTPGETGTQIIRRDRDEGH